MKLTLLISISIILVFQSCSRYTATVSIKKENTFLSIKNDTFKLKIKKVDKSNKMKSEKAIQERVYLKTNCTSLKDFICFYKDIDKKEIVDNCNNLDNRFYSVVIEQYKKSPSIDSIIDKQVFQFFGIKVEKKKEDFETIKLKIENREQYTRYLSKSKPAKLDGHEIENFFSTHSRNNVYDSIQCVNMNLGEIAKSLGNTFGKSIVADSLELQKVTFSLDGNGWNSFKQKLQTEIGLSFTSKMSQRGKYEVNKN